MEERGDQYLLDHANAMFRLLETYESFPDEPEGAADVLALAARKGCQGLSIFATELGEHVKFRAKVEDAMDPADEAYRAILHDPIALNRFLLAEEHVMVAAGMDPALAREVFGHARFLVREVPSGGESSMKRLEKCAYKLAHHACVEAEDLRDRVPPQPTTEQPRRLRWFLYGLAGAAVIAVNVTADALLLLPSHGALSGVVSQMSVPVGEAVLVGAVAGAMGEETGTG